MNISVYLFGKFDKGYTQYPDDYSRKIFAVCHQNSKAVSQIAIHRDGDLMYYAYIRNLDDGNYIGLCSVVNGKMITNIELQPKPSNRNTRIISISKFKMKTNRRYNIPIIFS